LGPSGASAGARKALELRDGGSAFSGKASRRGSNISTEKLLSAVIGTIPTTSVASTRLSFALDGTNDKPEAEATSWGLDLDSESLPTRLRRCGTEELQAEIDERVDVVHVGLAIREADQLRVAQRLS
jgi:hypothetical protein